MDIDTDIVMGYNGIYFDIDDRLMSLSSLVFEMMIFFEQGIGQPTIGIQLN